MNNRMISPDNKNVQLRAKWYKTSQDPSLPFSISLNHNSKKAVNKTFRSCRSHNSAHKQGLGTNTMNDLQRSQVVFCLTNWSYPEELDLRFPAREPSAAETVLRIFRWPTQRLEKTHWSGKWRDGKQKQLSKKRRWAWWETHSYYEWLMTTSASSQLSRRRYSNSVIFFFGVCVIRPTNKPSRLLFILLYNKSFDYFYKRTT